MNVDIRHLRSFLVVAEELNFTRAAKRLRTSQPSLTRTVNGLERMLGAQLLNRTTRRVSLTIEGERLKTDVERLLKELDSILDIGGAPARLRLGFTWLLPDTWAQQAITQFEADTHVQVELVRRDEVFAGVDAGRSDIAVLRGELAHTGLQAVLLFRERRVAAVRRNTPLANQSRIHWHDLADSPLVVNTVSGTTRPELWPANHRPMMSTETTNFDEWLEAVAAGRGVGVVPISAAYRVIHPAIRFVALEGAPLVPVYLVFPRQGSHPFTRQFVSAARRAALPPHTSPPLDVVA
ncbi:DNA-binding transcriptional LysR family regulator [Actinocrispum wychmicini]|uniref:DNA-binding transcriptional LysR family regulator n=1 Tax=Actinocrispum wychmicini TaxID=1213861 RepID=A0A4R2JPC7_9PSEU|nr:DNA-binding transcriptional LysR family regulator [Actinocrispum wychmicini]